METTETLDKLYLEWSQFTGARTARELAYRHALRHIQSKVNEDLAFYIRDKLRRHGDGDT